jgi:hypothetical protein
VIDSVGRERFSGICSDSTGNTKRARELVAEEVPGLIILADPCHHLNNLAKDLCKHTFFAQVLFDNNNSIVFTDFSLCREFLS